MTTKYKIKDKDRLEACIERVVIVAKLLKKLKDNKDLSTHVLLAHDHLIFVAEVLEEIKDGN